MVLDMKNFEKLFIANSCNPRIHSEVSLRGVSVSSRLRSPLSEPDYRLLLRIECPGDSCW